MYAAEIQKHDERLIFQVSGKLWQRSLVMRDKQTGSLWAHLLGECMEGPLKGSVLTPIAAIVTTWHEWKNSHPKTTVLSLKRTATKFNADVYKEPKAYVVGAESLGTTRAWPYDFLIKNPVYQDKLGPEEVIVVFLADSATGFVFKRKMGDEILNFSPKLKDGVLFSKDGTAWDLWNAKAIAGPRKGQLLERVHAIPSFRKSWIAFHPDSSIAK